MTAGNDHQHEEAPEGDRSAESAVEPTLREPTLNEGLKARLVSAVLLIPVSLGLVYVGEWPFALSLVFVAALMAFEWNRLVLGPENQGKITIYVLINTALITGVLALGLEGQWAFALLLSGLATLLVYFLALQQKLSALWPAAGVPISFCQCCHSYG